ncbi:uncharacterized protein [Bemisia tabaci]|uniref:uncharacterized protein n=1 Tax=Bemisia tabaci TaxID=7038 RepID=UPI003B289A1B
MSHEKESLLKTESKKSSINVSLVGRSDWNDMFLPCELNPINAKSSSPNYAFQRGCILFTTKPKPLSESCSFIAAHRKLISKRNNTSVPDERILVSSENPEPVYLTDKSSHSHKMKEENLLSHCEVCGECLKGQNFTSHFCARVPDKSKKTNPRAARQLLTELSFSQNLAEDSFSIGISPNPQQLASEKNSCELENTSSNGSGKSSSSSQKTVILQDTSRSFLRSTASAYSLARQKRHTFSNCSVNAFDQSSPQFDSSVSISSSQELKGGIKNDEGLPHSATVASSKFNPASSNDSNSSFNSPTAYLNVSKESDTSRRVLSDKSTGSHKKSTSRTPTISNMNSNSSLCLSKTSMRRKNLPEHQVDTSKESNASCVTIPSKLSNGNKNCKSSSVTSAKSLLYEDLSLRESVTSLKSTNSSTSTQISPCSSRVSIPMCGTYSSMSSYNNSESEHFLNSPKILSMSTVKSGRSINESFSEFYGSKSDVSSWKTSSDLGSSPNSNASLVECDSFDYANSRDIFRIKEKEKEWSNPSKPWRSVGAERAQYLRELYGCMAEAQAKIDSSDESDCDSGSELAWTFGSCSDVSQASDSSYIEQNQNLDSFSDRKSASNHGLETITSDSGFRNLSIDSPVTSDKSGLETKFSSSSSMTVSSDGSGANDFFTKIKKFGPAIGSLKKPGQHVGPSKNPDCSCQSCVRFFIETQNPRGF